MAGAVKSVWKTAWLGGVLALGAAAGAQSLDPATFDTFAYGSSWSAGPGQFVPSGAATLVQPSPNGVWQKVVWGLSPFWPTVDYLAENVALGSGPSRVVLSVTPPAGPGLPAGGAEILTDSSRRLFGFGSYRVRAKVSPPTPTDVGVCNAFYFINDQCEIDIEFLSDKQARSPGSGRVDIVVHDYAYLPGNRISVHRPLPLAFDPTAAFHVFGFDWRPGRVDFYVDDALLTTVKTGDLGRINIGGNVFNLPIALPTAANVRPSAMRLCNWTDLLGWCGVAPSVKTDFEVDWVSYAPAYFTSDSTRISIGAGGTAALGLDAGAARAGSVAVVLASLKDIDLGFQLPFQPAIHMPFEFDWALTPLLLSAAGSPAFPSFISMLDAQGQAAAALRLLPGQVDPSAAGWSFHFAFLTVHPVSGVIGGSSSGLAIGLTP